MVDQSVIAYLDSDYHLDLQRKTRQIIRSNLITYYNSLISEIACPYIRSTKRTEDLADELLELRTIHMTDHALSRALGYADSLQVLCRTAGLKDSHELYLYGLNRTGSSLPLIEESYVGKGQSVTPVSCDMTPGGIIASIRDITAEPEARIASWIHSHGNMPAFHSMRDNRNILELLQSDGISRRFQMFSQSGAPFSFLLHHLPSIVIADHDQKKISTAMAVEYPQLTGEGDPENALALFGDRVDTTPLLIDQKVVMPKRFPLHLEIVSSYEGMEEGDLTQVLLERVFIDGKKLSDIVEDARDG